MRRYDMRIDAEYDEFFKDNRAEFIRVYGDSVRTKRGTKYKPVETNMCGQSSLIKKAKLQIYAQCKSKGVNVYNEISARKKGAHGAPTIDLWDTTHFRAFELHWRNKELKHNKMIERMKKYEALFGKPYLILLKHTTDLGRTKGFTYLQPHILERYKEAGIKVVFFDVDDPNFDWLELE